MDYLVLKTLHILSIIAWMAGLLYLPRLFVYHADVSPESETASVFKLMERRLLRIIMTPALIASWIFGLGTAYVFDFKAFMQQPWFHLKLGLVILLVGHHFFLAYHVRLFARGNNHHSAIFYRVINEIPVPLIILIVGLVVIRPFES